jgi:hypothetical protein
MIKNINDYDVDSYINYYDPLIKLDLFIRGKCIFYITTETIFYDLMWVLMMKNIPWYTNKCPTTINYDDWFVSKNLHLQVIRDKIFPVSNHGEVPCIRIDGIDLHAIKNHISAENYKVNHATDKKDNNSRLKETISKQQIIIDSLVDTIRRMINND